MKSAEFRDAVEHMELTPGAMPMHWFISVLPQRVSAVKPLRQGGGVFRT